MRYNLGNLYSEVASCPKILLPKWEFRAIIPRCVSFLGNA
jgi:hypothetical protein